MADMNNNTYKNTKNIIYPHLPYTTRERGGHSREIGHPDRVERGNIEVIQ